MIIGIDAREIKNPYTGTGMYVTNLIKSLAEEDFENQYLLFVEYGVKLEFDLPNNFFYYNLINLFSSKFQDQIIIPIAILISKVDVFHVIHHDVTPLFSKAPLIVTVLDVFWLDFPGTSSIFFQKGYYFISKFSLKKAKKIITISESTKQRVLHFFPNVSHKIESILISCDPIFSFKTNEDNFSSISSEFQIKKPFVLYVGSFAARKNVKILIEAMKVYWNNNNKFIQLVIAGKPSGKDDEILNVLVNNYPVVIISRPKTNSELKALYNNATVFVFPSLYEGFGLPVLEAMSCGCPVITSNSTSIPEIVGNSDFFFEPNDKISLATMIEDILHDEFLQLELSEKGIGQSLKFSWKSVGRSTIKNYLSLNV
jgi:glycosyltransferase involved in cell wall biosynthesis